MHSSNALPGTRMTRRIDWRPSRVLIGALGLIGLSALLSLWLSALPASVASLLAGAVAIHSAMLIRRELQREQFTLAWAGDETTATLNFGARTQSLTEPKLSLRGPLASLHGKDEAGRSQRYLWWPDTLPSAARRELRLLDQAVRQSRAPASARNTA